MQNMSLQTAWGVDMRHGECVGCGACKNICPKHCITLKYNKKGFFSPIVEKELCIDCHLCEQVCPVDNDYQPNKEMQSGAFFINHSEYYRGISSSGGFFYALAYYVIKQRGLVYGVYLDKDFSVKHGCAETEDELFPLMTSKYVQSDTGTSYTKVKQSLAAGRLVLYTGTPCQIAGLLCYLGKEPDNLLTMELFCHGVPSQYSWKKYLAEYHGNETIRYVQFRYKFLGWWNRGLRLQYLHTDYYHSARSMQDPYMRAFLTDINLNDMCYHCKFKSDKKNADFTIGDAWNINRVRTNMDDNRGISTVLINSMKAEHIMKELKEEHHCFPISLDDALFVRGELQADKKIPVKRESFFRDLYRKGFRYAIENNNI